MNEAQENKELVKAQKIAKKALVDLAKVQKSEADLLIKANGEENLRRHAEKEIKERSERFDKQRDQLYKQIDDLKHQLNESYKQIGFMVMHASRVTPENGHDSK